MAHSLHEKIEFALAQRGLLKRDLARALSVSPQTATDICKGRSAVTLPHLRNLVAMFGLRADFWLDDSRLASAPGDEVAPERDAKLRALADHELLAGGDPAALVANLLTFARERRDDFVRRFPQITDEQRALLGLATRANGRVGQVNGNPTPPATNSGPMEASA
jgi:transcriptional regulator with XRE-family HTH domain